MPQLLEVDYNQIYLLPPCLEDWIGPDHQARFIREFVKELKLKKLGFVQPKEGLEGRPAYAPAFMLRIWLYGYLRKVRSARKLEQACKEDVGFIWLCGHRPPDHNSLWRFWQTNKAALGNLFKQTVRVAIEAKLVGFVLQALDGTKIQAFCSGKGGYDKESLLKRLSRLNEIIAQQEHALEQNSKEEESLNVTSDVLGSTQELRERIVQAIDTLEKEQIQHVHPQEQEARRMKTDSGNRFGYNAQAVVDHKERIVLAADVVNDPNDMGMLNEMIQQAQKNTGKQVPTVVDAGYASGQQLEEAMKAGHEVLSSLREAIENPKDHPFHAVNFHLDQNSDEVICPQGRRIPLRRIRERKGVLYREYQNAKVCQDCPVRNLCTKSKHGRFIEIAPWTPYMRQYAQEMKDPVRKAVLKMRSETIETVFGWIKQNGNFRRWSARGLDNVRAQWALICSTINLQAIYKTWKQTIAQACHSTFAHSYSSCAVYPIWFPLGGLWGHMPVN